MSTENKPVYIDPSSGQLREPRSGDTFINEPDVSFDNISDLTDYKIDQSPRTKTANVMGYYSAGDGGGGTFYWDSSEDKANHNGGTLINPDHNSTIGSANWYSATGDSTDTSGSGCWVRPDVLITNIKHYGAKGDDGSEDSHALLSALEYAKNVTKVLYIPTGTYQLGEGAIALDNSHNGLSIIGDGASSVLKLADIGSFPSDNHQLIYLDVRGQIIEDINIHDLALDGNKGNTGYSGSSGWGIRTLSDDKTNQTKNINIENIWSYDHKSSGIEISSKNVNLSNIHSYNNSRHGIATGSTVHVECNLSNAFCYDNGSYGIDISDGSCKINNFECYSNSKGGLKTSTQLVRLEATNGYLHDNSGRGFIQTSSPSDSYVFLDNITTENNTAEGFRFTHSDEIIVGKITSINDDTNGTTGGLSSIFIENKNFKADTIIVKNASQNGILCNPSNSATINTLIAVNNSLNGLSQPSSATHSLNVKSGYVYNNGGEGIFIRSIGKSTLEGIKFGDNQSTPTQTIDINIQSNGVCSVNDCDFTDSDGNMVRHLSAKVTINDCKGIINEESGTETQSGDGSTTQFTISHALDLLGVPRSLAGPKSKLNVTPASSDAIGDFYVDYDEANITINYSSAPASGTDNLKWIWDIYYYAFDDR